MQDIRGRRMLPLLAAVVAAFSIASCGDRSDPPAGSTTTTTTVPATTVAPANTAAPATGTASESSVRTPPASAGLTLGAADREFFALANSSDMLEMQAGRLALDKSKNAEVRTFAQKMVDDHTKASENLREAASSVGMTLPAAMSPPHVAHLERLRGLIGAEFDREYAAQIGVASHQEAVGLFERASREAANVDVRAFADTGLAAKSEHLELGQTLADKVGVSADRLRLANAPPDLSSLSATISSGASNTTSTTGSGVIAGADSSKGRMTTSRSAAPVATSSPDAAERK